MGQRVLERVLGIRKQGRLVEELGGPETFEAERQVLAADVGNRLQQLKRDVLAHHGGGLQEALLGRRQAIDPGGQDRLHRSRHLDGLHRPGQPGARAAGKHPGLDQSAHASPRETAGCPPCAR